MNKTDYIKLMLSLLESLEANIEEVNEDKLKEAYAILDDENSRIWIGDGK